jgi:hypothetical protein
MQNLQLLFTALEGTQQRINVPGVADVTEKEPQLLDAIEMTRFDSLDKVGGPSIATEI